MDEVRSLSQFKCLAEEELSVGAVQDESLLLWLWAKALVALGEESLERADFKRALSRFKLAREEGCFLPFILARLRQSTAFVISIDRRDKGGTKSGKNSRSKTTRRP